MADSQSRPSKPHPEAIYPSHNSRRKVKRLSRRPIRHRVETGDAIIETGFATERCPSNRRDAICVQGDDAGPREQQELDGNHLTIALRRQRRAEKGGTVLYNVLLSERTIIKKIEQHGG